MASLNRIEQIIRHVQPCSSASSSLVERPDKTLFVTAEEAAKQIPDNATVALAGFVGCSCPESVLDALRARYDATSSPRGLCLMWGISSGDKKQRGFGVLAREGLLKRVIYAWTASAPQFVPLVKDGKVEAYNLPLGIISHLTRAIGAGAPGLATKVGLNTFADPREKGGKLNSRTKEELSQVRQDGDREYLWFPAFPVHVAVLRASYADLEGKPRSPSTENP